MEATVYESTTAQGRAFERRVGMLFELLGYRVDPDRLVAGRQVDLFLEDRSGPLTRLYIVECKDQANPVNTSQYDAFRGRLYAGRNDLSPKLRGILVASVGFVKEVKAQALHEDIELLTISELESSVIDFRQYVRDLIRQLQDTPALAHFVPPRLVREQLTVPEPAMGLVERWLTDPEANQLTLLGDYGTGKTTFLQNLALHLARRYEKEVIKGGARGRVPIFVDLKEYTQALSLKQIVLDLLDNHGIRAASYAAFEYILREGQVLLILDGFDEMASRGNHQVTLRNFRELNRSALGRAKIILSCRSHYFTDQRDMQRFLGRSNLPEAPVFYTDLYREIAGRPNFLLTYLQEFDSREVDTYLENRCGREALRVREFIANTYNLEELSRRPVLLDMIVSSAGSLPRQAEPTEPVTPGILYRIYTDIWLSRNDWSTLLDVETKRGLLEFFAAKAIAQEDAQLHFTEIPALIRAWRPGTTDVDEAEIDRELRTATFLVRDQGGEYRFSHSSFLEFFYSHHLVSTAARGQAGAWTTAVFRTEIYRFVQDLLALKEARPALDQLLAWVIDPAADPRARGYAVKCVSRLRHESVTAALIQVLGSEGEPRLRRFAATALGYHPRPEVARLLMRLAGDETQEVLLRSNACLSLVRIGLDEGIAFLASRLEGHFQGQALKGPMLSMIFRAAKTTPRMDLVRTCLQCAGQHLGDPEIALLGLELCAARPCPEGEDLCHAVLRVTESPRLALAAFASLPVEQRSVHFEKMETLLDQYPRHPNARQLVLALRDLNRPDVEAFLLRLVTQRSPLALNALEVLARDYPAAIARHGREWISGLGRRSHQFNLQIAQAYIGQQPAGGRELLHSLFLRSRPVTKRGLLDLYFRFYPGFLAGFLRENWDREPVTLVKRHALELLLQADLEAAVELMLTKGIREKRTGTRVAVCTILAAVRDDGATEALLDRLRHDPSRYVRLQSLRSLVSPGRKVDRERIAEAMAGEADPDVLTLKSQLLSA
jgi:hypothetical protein